MTTAGSPWRRSALSGGRRGPHRSRPTAQPLGAGRGGAPGRGTGTVRRARLAGGPAQDREPVSSVQVILGPGGSPLRIRPAWVAVRMTPADAVAVGAGRRRRRGRARRGGRRDAGRADARRGTAGRPGCWTRTGCSRSWSRPPGWTGRRRSTGAPGARAGWCTPAITVTGWEPARGMLGAGRTPGRRLVHTARRRAGRTRRGRGRAAGRSCGSASDVVQASVDGTGVRLRRLDGEQAPAVYAAAPTAMPPAGPGLRRRNKRETGRDRADRRGTAE